MIEFRIDYLKFTIWSVDFQAFWAEFYQDKLGALVPLDHGAKGFYEVYQGGAGSRVCVNPIDGSNAYFQVEFKGQACSCLTPLELSVPHDLAKSGIRVSITRIDFAWTGVPFTVDDFYQVLTEGDFISAASRRKIRMDVSPFDKREDGQIGSKTVYLGSRSSGRMLRVYDKHGPVRVELECKEEWSRVLGMAIFDLPYSQWSEFALGCLIKFFRCQEDWWLSFVDDTQMTDIRVHSARHISLDRTVKWMVTQVAPAFTALTNVLGVDELHDLLYGEIFRNPERLDRWRAVMELV